MLARKKPGTRVRCRKTCLVWRGAIFLVLVVLAFYTGGDKESEPKTSSRKLHEVSLFDGVIGKECSDFESSGGFVLHIIGVLVTFLGLAIICDDFFVESLEKISSALNLSGLFIITCALQKKRSPHCIPLKMMLPVQPSWRLGLQHLSS